MNPKDGRTYFICDWCAETAALCKMDSIIQDSLGDNVRISLDGLKAVLKCRGAIPTEFTNYLIYYGTQDQINEYLLAHANEWEIPKPADYTGTPDYGGVIRGAKQFGKNLITTAVVTPAVQKTLSLPWWFWAGLATLAASAVIGGILLNG